MGRHGRGIFLDTGVKGLFPRPSAKTLLLGLLWTIPEWNFIWGCMTWNDMIKMRYPFWCVQVPQFSGPDWLYTHHHHHDNHHGNLISTIWCALWVLLIHSFMFRARFSVTLQSTMLLLATSLQVLIVLSLLLGSCTYNGSISCEGVVSVFWEHAYAIFDT